MNVYNNGQAIPGKCSTVGCAIGRLRGQDANWKSYIVWLKPVSQGPVTNSAKAVVRNVLKTCTSSVDREVYSRDLPGLAECFRAQIHAASGIWTHGVLCVPADNRNDLAISGLSADLISVSFPSDEVPHDTLFEATCYILVPPA